MGKVWLRAGKFLIRCNILFSLQEQLFFLVAKSIMQDINRKVHQITIGSTIHPLPCLTRNSGTIIEGNLTIINFSSFCHEIKMYRGIVQLHFFLV